ncbi:MAG TPA: hypothetical protein VGH28_19090 [Polyangiaceae bacterium]|jgi:hypothetical protein
MADISIIELQAVAGGLRLAKRTLDDVLARVGRDPGPINDPAAQTALQAILDTSAALNAEAKQIQALGAPGTAPGTTP